MHKIQSTYSYGSFASVQVPVYGFPIPGAKAQRAQTPLLLVRSDDPKNNFPLNFFDDNINQYRNASNPSIQSTKNTQSQDKKSIQL